MTSERVLITGASSGIGAALAALYAGRGARLALIARDADRLQAVASATNGTPFIGDVGDPATTTSAARHARQAWDGLDVVVANAGYALRGDVTTLPLDDLRRQFATNVFGVVATIQATLPLLRATRGRLVIIGSLAGTVAVRDTTAYAMSKAALRPLVEGLRQELTGSGVSVTLITPGLVLSDINRRDRDGRFAPEIIAPHQRWAMPAARAARRILWAVDQRRPEAVITWHAWFLLLAWRWCPWLVRPFLTGG
jgi:uncharacterized protein